MTEKMRFITPQVTSNAAQLEDAYTDFSRDWVYYSKRIARKKPKR